MKTPKHLQGLMGVVVAVDNALAGTGFEWLIRTDDVHGYFANIFVSGTEQYPHHDPTPAGALSRSLMEFNLRRRT